jgi:hypothetical protein
MLQSGGSQTKEGTSLVTPTRITRGTQGTGKRKCPIPASHRHTAARESDLYEKSKLRLFPNVKISPFVSINNPLKKILRLGAWLKG